ncbi:MAG: 1-acyl-sn-glycerol-3-phosphate acyltransferase [Eubacterium sp.]|nr:1-acyl-sn-glycerol-3-phosphate acyltransferase [Eubacterium sp.]
MRTIILVFVYIIVIVLSFCLLMPIGLIIRLFSKKASAAYALFIVKCAFNLCMFISGCKKEVVGLEKVPTDTAVMYAANHRGFYDIILLYSIVPTQTAFVAKSGLRKFFCIAQWMWFLDCMFIERDNIKQSLEVILKAIALVKSGTSVYISPEGTRNPTDELLEFKEGSMKIATKGKVPIVPVCFTGTEKIMEESMPWVHSGKIRVEFGDPIYPDKLEKEELKHIGRYTRDVIQKLYDSTLDSED